MNYAIMPVRNGLHFTRKAVADLKAQTIGCQVMVIDNDSHDGTAQWLQTQTDVLTMHNSPGLSVAASWNAGLRWVFGQGLDHCFVLNNDVRLRPDTLHHLLEDGSGFVTAVGTRDESKIAPPYHVPDPAKKRNHPDYSCWLIHKWVFDKVWFDERYEGAYCEDASHHLSMHRAGIEAVCLDLPFVHYGAKTIELAYGTGVDTEIKEQADRNRALFREQYGVDVGSKEYYALFGHDSPD